MMPVWLPATPWAQLWRSKYFWLFSYSKNSFSLSLFAGGRRRFLWRPLPKQDTPQKMVCLVSFSAEYFGKDQNTVGKPQTALRLSKKQAASPLPTGEVAEHSEDGEGKQ